MNPGTRIGMSSHPTQVPVLTTLPGWPGYEGTQTRRPKAIEERREVEGRRSEEAHEYVMQSNPRKCRARE